MKQNKDVITFEVNETLYFENGQEIAEMLSISLDPEIAIQTYDNYIQVRGLILLQGEYIKASEKSDQHTNSFLNDDLTGYIEKVIDTDDNEASFSHRFPVEITVPPYRVENLEDVTVTIDSFDYELPDQGKLKIKSTVHINGIKADASIVQQEEKVFDENEQKKQTKKLQEIKDLELEQKMEENKTEIDSVAVAETNEMKEKGKNDVKDKTIIETNVKETVKEDVNEKVDDEIIEEAVEEVTEEVEEVSRMEHHHLEESNDENETNEIDIQLNESEAEEDDEVKDVQFLTDLFGGEEEEQYSKMRIYITQEEDTIETIAKRYEISALQLIKDNNLAGDSIEEGQLLHLPIPSKE